MKTQSEWTGVLVRLPVGLKGAIVAEVERQDTNMNDLIVGTLAHRFGLPFSPSERCCHTASPEKTKVFLRMSPRLKRKMQHHAVDAGSNLTDTVTRVMADELNIAIDLPQPKRGTPFGGGPQKYRRSFRAER